MALLTLTKNAGLAVATISFSKNSTTIHVFTKNKVAGSSIAAHSKNSTSSAARTKNP